MKKALILGSFLGLISLGCHAQDKKTTEKETENKPKTSYQVHKEYDEHGNLIRLDSTYSYVYSSTEMDPKEMEEFMQRFSQMGGFGSLDSIFNFGTFQFPSNFENLFNHSFSMHPFSHNSFKDFFKRFDSIKRAQTPQPTLPMR